MDVIGWGFHYGRDPEAEAKEAVRVCRQLGHTIYVCNAEIEFEESDGAERALRFIKAFRQEAGESIQLGLSTFALPSLHPLFPYAAFLEGNGACEFVMPQIYTVPSRRNPFLLKLSIYAQSSMQELGSFGKTVVPTLRAYTGDGLYDWEVITSDAANFLASPLAASLPGFNWWLWQSAETHPPLWDLLGEKG